MDSDISLFIKTCSTCNVNKNHPKNRASLTSYHAGIPNERVHLDFLGPFTTSERGNKYILSIIDQFTKWIEIYALPEQTALLTAKTFFEGWIARFGVPLQIHTDQGRNFTSNLFTDLCKILDSAKTRTTPYRPSSNGQVERYNQLILSYIRCQIEGDDANWDEHLPILGLSLRSTVNRSTGFTPNRLQLGREVNLPMDIMFNINNSERKSENSAEYVQEVENKMREVFARTRQQLQAAQCRQKIDYDTRGAVREKLYEVGDLVYMLNSATHVGHCSKLQPIMTGPYVICNSVSMYLYVIQGRRRKMVVHQDRLRLCEDRCIPLWIQRVRNAVLGLEIPEVEDEPVHEVHQLFEMVVLGESEDAQRDAQHFDDPNDDSTDDAVEVTTVTQTGRHIKRPARFLD